MRGEEKRTFFCIIVLNEKKNSHCIPYLFLMPPCLSKSTFVPQRSYIFPLTVRRLDVLLNRWTEFWPLAYVLTVSSEPVDTVMTACDKSFWFGWNYFYCKMLSNDLTSQTPVISCLLSKSSFCRRWNKWRLQWGIHLENKTTLKRLLKQSDINNQYSWIF